MNKIFWNSIYTALLEMFPVRNQFAEFKNTREAGKIWFEKLCSLQWALYNVGGVDMTALSSQLFSSQFLKRCPMMSS